MGWLPDPVHPAIVHFPIALSLAAVLLDLVSRHRCARGLEAGGAVLMALAALGSVAALARRLGVSPRTIQRWASGTRRCAGAALILLRQLQEET